MPEDVQKSGFFEYIERNEGTRYTPYPDIYGKSTIGVGHLIKKGEKFGKIDDKKVTELFDGDLKNAISIVKEDIGEMHWDILPDKVQFMLADSAFRGQWQISPKAREHFKNQDYYAYAKENLDSAEYRLSKKEGTGVAPRMDRNAQVAVDYANAIQEGWDFNTAVEEGLKLQKAQNQRKD